MRVSASSFASASESERRQCTLQYCTRGEGSKDERRRLRHQILRDPEAGEGAHSEDDVLWKHYAEKFQALNLFDFFFRKMNLFEFEGDVSRVYC